MEILESHNPNEICNHPHVLDNYFERDYSLNYVLECLINKIPLSISKTFEVEYFYNKSIDTLGIKVKRDFQYWETIEMDEGILLDFDINNVPNALEILR